MKALILAGGQDTRKCPLSMVRPRPLFPLLTDVLLQHLLKRLRAVGVDEAIICADGKTRILEAHFDDSPSSYVRLDFHDETFPRGTAGCLQDVEDLLRDETFLVLEGGLFIEGDLQHLIDDHVRSGSAMTVGAVPLRDWRMGDGSAETDDPLAPLGIYVVEPEVLDHIPGRGYCDIKEQLIPRLREKFLDVWVARFRGRHRRVFDADSYGAFVDEVLSGAFGDDQVAELDKLAPHVWAGPDIDIDPSATLLGPVAVGRGAVIGKEATVVGPTLIGENVFLDDQTVVTGSILWPNVTVGLGAKVEHSIVADSFHVSVFSHLSHCVAIDHELTLGDLYGLKQGGYAVGVSTGAGRPPRKTRRPLAALTNACRCFARARNRRP
jgi:mannose-1-phosphate guanylyltransferase/phosphomannomutase